MSHALINPQDSLARQNEKLLKITETLMRRVEQNTDASGLAYAQFQRAAMLEEEVRARTHDLERALELLNESNAKLAIANRETEAARSNLANAIETVQEGFALFNADDELVMCNSRFGMHMPDIRPQLKPGLMFPDYVQIVSQSMFLSLPEGEAPADWAQRRMKHHQDNSVIFNARMTGKRWVQVSEHRTPDGGTVILQTDVTDIMRLERRERERMRDDQARLIRATLEHLKQGVCIFDTQGRLVGWNRRVGELLSIPVGRFQIGNRFATIFERLRDDYSFSADASPRQVQAWAGQEGKRPPLTFEIQGRGGRVLTVFMQQMPDGGFVISFTDVTAERQAIRAVTEAKETLEQRVLDRTLELEDALAEAERANASKSRFVAAASHDLLQPLSAAKLYLSSLEQDLAGDRSGAMASKAANALQSVENILGALLDISKLDSGQASVHLVPISLDLMLSQLCDELRPMANAKGLEFQVLRSGAQVLSDATYLQRILQNLISNAIRYTDSGRVLVGARQLRHSVRVEVWDTGPGIAEHEQDQIFGEFQRLNATASAADGMGLGLAIVERACALLGHPLGLSSWPGRGTVFSVELPRAGRADVPTADEVPIERSESGQIAHRIVLLIENDAELRNALSVTMEQWGLDVLACCGEDEAIALLDEIGVAPDVVVADMQLDDGRLGSDVVMALRSRFGPLPACLISADRSPALKDAAGRLGALLLHKPFDPAALKAYLAGLPG
ncbi:PAS-domain containing protein [Ruegeria sp. 2205SS24-7]|uniref:PAS-domain containing protein n=1 Tax=Ruegeria discodermiae TaxID=3064389 RepID=UPI002740DE16|nr:PAS-domain containing protein [Ruegeria sp. 2205SS24-7]MDP5219176.1 PAS-domain containing protein [Ruegeria sp. 2205SS24-7]